MEQLNEYHERHLTMDDSLEAYHQRQAASERSHRIETVSLKMRMIKALDSGKVRPLVSRQQYDIIVRFFKEGLTIREIAEELNIESSNVHVQLTRASENLKGKL
jgi:RNA polymerase sigma factor (sigma-70 family)